MIKLSAPYRRLLPYLKPHRGDFVLAALSMIVVALLNLASAGVAKPIIDKMLIERDIEKLRLLALAVPGLFFLKGLFSYLHNYLLTKIGHTVSQVIRGEFMEVLLNQDHSFHSRNPSPDLLARATNDIANIANMISNVPLFFIRDGLNVILMVGCIFYLNPKLALMVLLTTPVFTWVFQLFTSRLRKITVKTQELISQLYGTISEAIQGLSMIKIYLYEKPWLDKFNRQNKDYLRTTLKFQRITALAPALQEFLSGVVVALVLYRGGTGVIRGEWSAGAFVSFLVAAMNAYQPVKRMAQLDPIIQLGLTAWRRILEIKDTPLLISSINSAPEKPVKFDRAIEFRQVDLIYPDGRQALAQVDLTIAKGEVVGIAGPSGSGKSTLAALLARFYDPSKGSVAIDGHDLREWNIASLRQLLAFVTQDAFLFDDTIYANISIGRPASSRGDVESAAHAANAMEFIAKLPEGFETRVGERGMLLSAGQRQRLAIARAILKNPQILILDEATSNLDPESEEQVLAALSRLLQGKTAIVISHRVQTLGNTDRIFVIENSRFLEETTYARLLAGDAGRLASLLRTGG
ncbi:MAG: ATP-binding cassette domain-containing protein [Elusimicrobia bacterium]|nr:ATP-binding cassette domain-containing protein [Elusimicrobiota bacterium]